MKKLITILLCLPLLFSCGDDLDKEITAEMLTDGYTGKGTFTYDVGKYVGEFKEGSFHGQGTLTTPSGKMAKGLWENGEFIRE